MDSAGVADAELGDTEEEEGDGDWFRDTSWSAPVPRITGSVHTVARLTEEEDTREGDRGTERGEEHDEGEDCAEKSKSGVSAISLDTRAGK